MHIQSPFRSTTIFLALALVISGATMALRASLDAETSSSQRNASDSVRLENLRAMLAEHEAVLAGLYTRYKEKHPFVVQVKAEIADLKRAIREELQESAPAKQFTANEPELQRRVAPSGTVKEQERVHESREGLIASPLVLKSGLATIQSVLDASDLSLARTFADELANDFATTSRRIDNADFRVAAAVINRKLAALVQALGSSTQPGESDSTMRTAKLRISKALVEGLLKLVPDIQRFSDLSTNPKE